MGPQRGSCRQRVIGQLTVRPFELRVPLGPFVVDQRDDSSSRERLRFQPQAVALVGAGSVDEDQSRFASGRVWDEDRPAERRVPRLEDEFLLVEGEPLCRSSRPGSAAMSRPQAGPRRYGRSWA